MRNVHERTVDGTSDDVWALVETLATPNDRLWPRDTWPAMELDNGLRVGSRGGHDNVRYRVERVDPGRSVVFRFETPTGLDGVHRFEVTPSGSRSVLHHIIEATPTGMMRVAWPLVVRWMHDALIEDAFDNAEATLGQESGQRRQHSTYVRQLFRILVPHHPDRTGKWAGTGASITLGGIAALHLAWALGSTFPATDARSLARTVVGGNTFPSAAASAVVASLLGVASTLVAVRSRPSTPLGRRFPTAISRPGVLVVAAALGLRGGGGMFSSIIGVPKTTSTFRVLDLVLYSPLCLGLATAIMRMEKKPTHG